MPIDQEEAPAPVQIEPAAVDIHTAARIVGVSASYLQHNPHLVPGSYKQGRRRLWELAALRAHVRRMAEQGCDNGETA